MAYHLADIYLEELDKSLADPPVPSPLPVPLKTILQPFFALAARTPTKAMYQRMESALFEPLFSSFKPLPCELPLAKRPRLSTPTYTRLVSNACVSNPCDEGPLAAESLKVGLLRYVFEVASDDGTRDSNRRRMYSFWKSHADEEEDPTS